MVYIGPKIQNKKADPSTEEKKTNLDRIVDVRFNLLGCGRGFEKEKTG